MQMTLEKPILKGEKVKKLVEGRVLKDQIGQEK